jgi:hypothetical protein
LKVQKISIGRENEAEIPHSVDDERLLAGVCGGLLSEPESDQEIRAKPDALPSHEHQEIVVRKHQRQHREHEEVQVRKEAIKPRVVVHIRCRVDVYEEPDARDDEDHQAGQVIQHEAARCVERSRLEST